MAKQPKKRRLVRFARAVVPPGRFHSTKRGKRGYTRRESRREERRAVRDQKQEELGEAPRAD